MKKIKQYLSRGSFCFYCNVDSEEMKIFVIGIIGLIFLASFLVFLGAYFKGAFKNAEEIKKKLLEIEEE